MVFVTLLSQLPIEVEAFINKNLLVVLVGLSKINAKI